MRARARATFVAHCDSIIYYDDGLHHSMAVFRSVARDPSADTAHDVPVASWSNQSSAGDDFRLAFAAVGKNRGRTEPDCANGAHPHVESPIHCRQKRLSARLNQVRLVPPRSAASSGAASRNE